MKREIRVIDLDVSLIWKPVIYVSVESVAVAISKLMIHY